ncbi:alkene reductase [Vibrio kanaloae]|uniref:oxidoreductase n=1 Tax=Vibrio kanaloae TaxID=170673 RepID=UPI001F0E3B97|nr:alkene reductase [Vibrio kanaloae]
MVDVLLHPINLGSIVLKNRIVMPPVAFSEATKSGNFVNDMMATYYSRRSSAGLIIAEGNLFYPKEQGYSLPSALDTQEQIMEWKKITDSVHKSGGVIFAQLWYGGHPENIDGGQSITSSVVKKDSVKVFVDTKNRNQEYVEATIPKETTNNIFDIAEKYRQVALTAMKCGFDGVELHVENGYFAHQFIESEGNTFVYEYEGFTENRLLFLNVVVDTLISAIGKDRVGVRLAPFAPLNGTVDKNTAKTYISAVKSLNKSRVVYIHIDEFDSGDDPAIPIEFKIAIRDLYKGIIISTGRYHSEQARIAIESDLTDMVGFGPLFMPPSNLLNRVKNNQKFCKYNYKLYSKLME